MNPQVFVISAGVAPAHDYRWKTEGDDNYDLSPELREHFGWLDDEHPSILVERDSGGAFLVLVAGISSERRDYRNRIIRNAVLWRALTEDAARFIALEFLRSQDRLATACNTAIASADSAPGGFTVNWAVLRNVATPSGPSLPKGAQPDRQCFEMPLAEWEKTAKQIEQSGWPTEQAVLLVVTRLPSSSAMRALRDLPAWRFHHSDATRSELRPKAKPRPLPGQQTPENGARVSSSGSSTLTPPSKTSWAPWAIIGALLLLLLVWPRPKKKEIERLGFAEVEHKAMLLNITFTGVTTEDFKQVPRVEVSEKWSAEPRGWNPETRSWSVQLASPESKRDGKVTISFPFAVEKRLPRASPPFAWRVESEWKGEDLVLSVRMPDADPR